MKNGSNHNDYKKNIEIAIVNMGFVNSYIIIGEKRIILVDTGLPGNEKK
ncbi:hypothetical protein ES705_00230 [subsurface metagenome]|nr:hypothetical protein [Clostridia bacterium]